MAKAAAEIGRRAYLPEQVGQALGALRLVALDSLHDGHHNGLLCAERLAWLEATLAAAGDRPVVIALHHPPFATGIEWIDLTGGGWTADFERIVARHGTVQSVLAGHIHRPILRRWGGTVAVVSPSTTYQVAADLTDLEAHFTAEPPAIHLCLWTGDACVSHFLPVAAPGEPFEVIDRETLARLKAFAGQNDGLVPKNTSNALRNLTPPD